MWVCTLFVLRTCNNCLHTARKLADNKDPVEMIEILCFCQCVCECVCKKDREREKPWTWLKITTNNTHIRLADKNLSNDFSTEYILITDIIFVMVCKEIISKLCISFCCHKAADVNFDGFCFRAAASIEPRSSSVLPPKNSSHVSFYINKSFFSLHSSLSSFLSCTPTQSSSQAHEDGSRKERGGWGMTREKGKSAALSTASIAIDLLFLAGFFSPSLIPNTEDIFFPMKSELFGLQTPRLFSLFLKLPNYPRSSLFRDVDKSQLINV